MFGETPPGIILLDILLVVLGGVLLPMLYSISKSLRKIFAKQGELMTSLSGIGESIGKVSQEMIEERIRDINFQNQINNLQADITSLKQQDSNK